jgi:membrane-associated phospholipid phosphatase
MRPWITVSTSFFAYIALCAIVRPRVPARRRLIVIAGAAAGVALCVAAGLWLVAPVLHDWIFPSVALLAAYWVSGLLFVAPMQRAEAVLAAVDRDLRIDRVAASLPLWLAELLETAYLSVYPLVPLALILHRSLAARPDTNRFWTVILTTDFICFGCLPWMQTRPPRALTGAVPWRSRVRAVNLNVLETASVRVNTFPSGHAAEAMAAALLVSDTTAPVFGGMVLCAVLVTAGAVLGRYHYFVDAFAGWFVAIAVWLLVRG